MSSTLRSISKHVNTLSRVMNSSTVRSLHSPFAVLGNSPSTSPPPTSTSVYDQNFDPPFSSNPGSRTYEVSHYPSHTFYSVPFGAYPTSAPYVNFNATEAPNMHGAQISSTSTTLLAHPKITRAAPQHEGSVRERVAVRSAAGPGAMSKRGGGYGGLALMDKRGRKAGEGELAERNGVVAAKISKWAAANANLDSGRH